MRSSDARPGEKKGSLEIAPAKEGKRTFDEPLVIGVAASMYPVLEDLQPHFERQFPGVEVRLESGGSSALVRKVTDLRAPFDLLVLADVRLFEPLTKTGWTEQVVNIASDRMVLAHAPHKEDVTLSPETWAAEVSKSDVRFGIADPAHAPLGYRSLLVLQLEEKRSKRTGFAKTMQKKFEGRFVWPHATALGAHLEAGNLDYGLLYSSTAAELKMAATQLAPEVNLGSSDHAANYRTAQVEVPSTHRGSAQMFEGEPISYGAGFAKRRKRPELTALFQLLVGEHGADALQRLGFTPPSSP